MSDRAVVILSIGAALMILALLATAVFAPPAPHSGPLAVQLALEVADGRMSSAQAICIDSRLGQQPLPHDEAAIIADMQTAKAACGS